MKHKNQPNRRQFLIQSAGALAVGMAAGSAGAAEAAKPAFSAAERVTLGKTGLKPSLLGFGTGVKGWGGESDLTRKGHDAFMEMLEHAWDSGVRFYDLADAYGSHPYMREALENFIERDEVMILTKTISRDADGVKEDLDRFREEIGTDTLDVVLLHCLQNPNWLDEMQPAMDVLEKAKADGVIKAHGVSCHNFDAMAAAAEEPWVDVLLARINPFQVKMDGPPEKVAEVLRTAHDNGKGVLGMKILGEGQTVEGMEESLRYVLNLGCVDAITIGFTEPKQLGEVMQKIEATPAKAAKQVA